MLVPVKDTLITPRVPVATLALLAGLPVAALVAAGPGRSALAEVVLVFSDVLALWLFGPAVEGRLGRPAFLALVAAGAGAAVGLGTLAGADADPLSLALLGGIAAVIGAYLVAAPRAKVLSLVFLPFASHIAEVPAVALALAWLALQAVSAATGWGY